MNTHDRGNGRCPTCGRIVRLVRFRGSTSDTRDTLSVIGKHKDLKGRACEQSYMQLPAAAQ